MKRHPTYLRAIVTTRCPMACPYCHMEGDPEREGLGGGVPAERLAACLVVAARAGVRKFKLLGGEPLVRKDLPAVVATLRAEAPDADISVITSGVAPLSAVEALFAAGLTRMNLSIHGWTMPRFRERGGTLHKHALREAVLGYLVASGRPVKLNYVYMGAEDDADLAALLAWAAGQPVVVNLLDDLHDPQAGPHTLFDLVRRLRGDGWAARPEPDPHSLETTRLAWPDGLVVEIKTEHLGEHAPWKACAGCPARARCREGIYAVRLTHDGRLQPCMDRPEIAWPLADLATTDPAGAVARWHELMTEVLA